MKICCVEGCGQPGAFTTRTRPTWCFDHLHQLYSQGVLTLLEEFTKASAYLLTRCSRCGFEGHYRFEYVLDRLQAGELVCRACYWRAWAKGARAMSGCSDQPMEISSVKKNAEAHGYTYLGPLTNPSLEDDPHATRCNFCGRIEAQRNGDIGWGCPCRRNPKSATAGTKKARGANLLKNSSSRAVEWWDHDRNPESIWDTATLKARREAWWTCSEGHSFKSRILDVTNDYFFCPECQEIRRVAWEEKRASFAGKTISDAPELLAAWDDDLPPESVRVDENHWGSGYRFRCPAGHRNTRQPLSYLFGGCSACKAIKTRKANADAAAADPSASRLTPRIDAVLSIIEIAFRFLIGHRLGRIHPFAHRNPQILNAMRRDNSGCSPEPTTAYCKWLQEYNHDEAQAKDDFVIHFAIHFRKEYGPHLPIWVATEVMSFGVLSGLYGLMPEKDQSLIAARLQILTKDERGDRGTLMNWLNNLRITRNICAHYGRLWNRVLNILSVPGQVRNEPDSPLSSLLDNNANNHLYGILLIMRYLLLSIASENTDVLDIVDDIDKRLPQMGFSIRTIGSLKSGETIRFGINNSNSINHPCLQQVSLTALKA